jgi:hypothetical protein
MTKYHEQSEVANVAKKAGDPGTEKRLLEIKADENAHERKLKK